VSRFHSCVDIYLDGYEAHHTDLCRHGTTRPFKDPCLITAQVLSVIALILSFFSIWAWWVMLSYSLPAFILMQVAWCCAMNRCGFIAAGVLALLVAAIDLAAAIFVLIWLISFWEEDCDSYSNSNYDYDCWEYDENDASLWMNLCFASALLWLITGILVLCFGCGKRYQDIEDQLRAEGGAEGAAAKQLPSATSVPIAATRPMQQAGTNTTTITHMPDGSVERKSEVLYPDGSKTVSVVVAGRTLGASCMMRTAACCKLQLTHLRALTANYLRAPIQNKCTEPFSHVFSAWF
jgi:hypothetical protein